MVTIKQVKIQICNKEYHKVKRSNSKQVFKTVYVPMVEISAAILVWQFDESNV